MRKPAPDHTPPTGMAKLYVSVGKRDGLTDSELTQFFETHAPGVPVQLALLINHTYVVVPEDTVTRVLETTKDQTLAGKPVNIERARPRPK